MSGTRRTPVATILFTDLVDSTALLSRVGDERAQAIFRAHHRMLHEAVARHRGEELQWLGDGLMAAFASSADAVRCAVAMQQAAALQPPAERLAIRVGLNVGEVLQQPTGSGYFGTPVVVARRLCDGAKAGEILASRTIAALLSGRAAFRFRELGTREFKGLVEPVDVCLVLEAAEDALPATAEVRAGHAGAIARLADAARPLVVWVAGASVGNLVLGLLALALALGALGGVARWPAFRHSLRELAVLWEREFDPVVFEGGTVRVEGERLPRYSNETWTLLIDPEERIAEAEIATAEFLVIRSDRFLRRAAQGGVRETRLASWWDVLGGVLPDGPLRIDGPGLRAFADAHAGLLQAVFVAVVCANAVAFGWPLSILFALVAAVVVRRLGARHRPSFGGAFRICLAASALSLVLDFVLSLARLSPPPVWGSVLWIAALTGSVWLALRALPAEDLG